MYHLWEITIQMTCIYLNKLFLLFNDWNKDKIKILFIAKLVIILKELLKHIIQNKILYIAKQVIILKENLKHIIHSLMQTQIILLQELKKIDHILH